MTTVPPSIPANRGVILFAHGARDPRWGDPFRRVADGVREAAPGLPVELAYLEFLEPDLRAAAERLAQRGLTTIRIIPLFFGRGGHLRDAVPKLVAETAAALAAVTFELEGAAGEDQGVVDAIAAFCLRAAAHPRDTGTDGPA